MNNKLSVQHFGNAKLGKKISIFSRPVGETCSNECVHIDTNCYAERIERRFPVTRQAHFKNFKISNWQKLRAFILEAKRKENAIRWHVFGDFEKETKDGRKILDKQYVKDIIKAYESIIKDKISLPLSFCFTHSLRPEVAKLSKYIKIYASVEDTLTYKKAKKVGFKLFAWNSNLRKGKDTNKIWTTETSKNVVVCFEQRGVKADCSSCKFCFSPTVNLDIAFMQH